MTYLTKNTSESRKDPYSPTDAFSLDDKRAEAFPLYAGVDFLLNKDKGCSERLSSSPSLYI